MTLDAFCLIIFSDSTYPHEYFRGEEAVEARLTVWEFDVSDSLSL